MKYLFVSWYLLLALALVLVFVAGCGGGGGGGVSPEPGNAFTPGAHVRVTLRYPSGAVVSYSDLTYDLAQRSADDVLIRGFDSAAPYTTRFVIHLNPPAYQESVPFDRSYESTSRIWYQPESTRYYSYGMTVTITQVGNIVPGVPWKGVFSGTMTDSAHEYHVEGDFVVPELENW